MLMVESLFFTGAGTGVGAGEKNTRSRSKTDRLRNTAYSTRRLVVTCRAFTLKELRL